MANYPTKVDQAVTESKAGEQIYGGAFRLGELTLTSSSNPSVVNMNVAGVFVELNIFEDLFSNVIRGTFSFIDNQGIAEMIPIIGDETLVISYTTPGGEGAEEKELTAESGSEQVMRQRFKVYDCIEVPTGEQSTVYQLFFVSEEYVSSTKMKISKGYKGWTYDKIVKDIMTKLNKNTSRINHKKIYIEKTATQQNVIVPNWTPFQAINFCASRSLSANRAPVEASSAKQSTKPFSAGSLFLFYEKLGTGFFYESIESMILRQKMQSNVPLYQYRPKTVEGATGNIGMDFFGVEKFEIKSSFKTLENLGYGMYGSRLIAYDPIRMTYDDVKYDYYKKEENPVTQTRNPHTDAVEEKPEPSQAKDDSTRIFADFIATDSSPPPDSTQNKMIGVHSDYLGSNDASIKLATTTKNHDAMFIAPVSEYDEDGEYIGFLPTSIGVTKKTFQDSEAKSNRVENWLLQREMQVQEFNNIIISFSVPGNSSRHVGDLIRFELPSLIPPDAISTMGTTGVGHQLYSGYYLISKIRHKITTTQYETDMELIKNSFAKRIPGQNE